MFARRTSVCGVTFIGLLLLTSLTAPARAAQVLSTSYDLYNGDGSAGYGTVKLFDDSYTGLGSKTTAYAALSGGRGDLTDGTAALYNWGDCGGASPCVSNVPPSAPPYYNNAVYVGWNQRKLDAATGLDSTRPVVVTFHFAPGTNIDEVDISMNYGYRAGQVAFSMGGPTLTRTVSSTIGPANIWYDFTGLGLTGDTLVLSLFFQDQVGGPSDWIMVSEVQFFSPPEVPLPAALPLFATGLGALGLLGWRRKRKAFPAAAIAAA
jgi:hypothetical protein